MQILNNLFKGYVKTNGKIPEQKIKNAEYYSLDEVLSFDCDFGGVLKDYIVMIDIDDKESANTVKSIIEGENINCYTAKTSRGYHFYFNNLDISSNKIKTKLAVGLEGDIKLGDKNTVVPIMIEGALRSFNRLGNLDDIEKLPAFLKPIKFAKNFTHSETRNQDLFNYILTLQSANFSTEDIQTTIKIINKYILKEPLSETELNVIIRDEAFAKPCFYSNGKFQHHIFADWLIKERKVIKINGLLHFYKDDRYLNANYLPKEMIDAVPECRQSQRIETINYLTSLLVYDTPEASANYIYLKNGILDIETLELKEHNSDIIITNKIPYSYNPKARYKLIDDVLDKLTCNDNEIRLLLEEMVGYCMYRRNELGKFFVLTGDGGGGKSTFLNMFQQLFGEVNISNVSLKDCGDKFLKSDIVGKLVNIGDDISGAFIEDNSDFKKLVTGERMQFQFKNQNAFSSVSYAKLLFASNQLPRINDLTDGLMRRLVIIPFNAKFTKSEDYDPYIGEKLKTTEAMEYLLLLGINGLRRVLKNKGFSKSEKVEDSKAEYEAYNNSVIGFIDDGNTVINQPVNTIYRRYSIWCNENGLTALSNKKFSNVLKTKYQLTSKVIRINNETHRVYSES